MATSNNDRISSARLLDTLKGLQASRHLGSEPEVDPQTNEKTKHTIKQDYLPNADWSVNDPDADGYVQGRTHWVERTVGDIPVTTEQGMSTIPEMVKPEGFKFGTTTWKPDYEAIAFEETQGGGTFTGYLLAEDENGNQITDASSIFGGETRYTGVAIVDYSAYAPGLYLVTCKYDNQDAQADYVLGVTEVVHQLPKKYYEQTDETALKNEIYGYVDEKFVYNSIDVPQNAKCSLIVDNTAELERFLKDNNFEETYYSSSEHTRYKLTNSNGTIVVGIKSAKDYNRMYYYVAIANNTNNDFIWEYAFTNVLSATYGYVNISWNTFINENVMLIYIGDDFDKFNNEPMWFHEDNTVTINADGSTLTVGSISYNSVKLNMNSSKWFVFFIPYVNDKSMRLTYCVNGEIDKIYVSNGKTKYPLSDANTSYITDVYLNNTDVGIRVIVGEINGVNELYLNASEERTISKNTWFDKAINDNTFKWEVIDEIVDVHKTFTFEQTTSSQTYTNSIECWFDSNYDLHVKNLQTGRNIKVPKRFVISFTWHTNYLMPITTSTGAYSISY